MGLRHFAAAVAVAVVGGLAGAAMGQINPGGAVVGGVAISTDGFLQHRQTAAVVRTADRKAELMYVSLPRALEAWRAAKDAGREAPADVRYLKGLTRIQNVFVFPEQHDIVLAGPAEPYKTTNGLMPVGTITGRPVVQLEDLIVALRAVDRSRAGGPGGRGAGGGGGGGRDFYGCSLENPENFQETWTAILARYGRGPVNVLQAEMKKALGPQVVKLFGVPEDSRLALAMVAADYRLKRLCMGLETVAGLGHALGSENAAPRIWFEPSYEPLLVTADGNGYEFRGPRLKVLAGPQQFNPQGASAAQLRFSENFSKKMPEVAARVDAVADLQNIADGLMLAALIRQDRLTAKAGLDWGWLLAEETYKTASLPTPRTADTVVHVSGNVIAQGGVAFALARFSGVERETGASVLAAPAARPGEWFMARP